MITTLKMTTQERTGGDMPLREEKERELNLAALCLFTFDGQRQNDCQDRPVEEAEQVKTIFAIFAGL